MRVPTPEKRMAMLKISRVRTERRCRVVLEGELVSPWVAELKKEWNDIRSFEAGLTLIVDLTDVITISQEGKDFLLEMMSQGVKFISGGVHNRHVLQQLARKIAL
jgi:hypothetical protein